jgi:hypothetical protein
MVFKEFGPAVIEHARLEIAKHINGNIDSAYWEIGKMLHERKVESGHWDGVVRQLTRRLERTLSEDGVFTSTALEHEEVLSSLCRAR